MKKSIGSKSRFLTGIAFLFAILSITNSCKKPMDNMSNMGNSSGNTSGNTTGNNTGGKGGSSSPGTNEVWIQGMAFNPSTITVAIGTTITWTNKDTIAHTITSDSSLFNSGSVSSGGTYTYKFLSAGTFSYHCTIHPLMTAKVVVTAAPVTNAAVSIENMSFVPATITVSAGTTITWTNNDSVAHTVTSDSGLFDSSSISASGYYSSGGTFSHTFQTKGTYLYHCSIHPSMTANVIVN